MWGSPLICSSARLSLSRTAWQINYGQWWTNNTKQPIRYVNGWRKTGKFASSHSHSDEHVKLERFNENANELWIFWWWQWPTTLSSSTQSTESGESDGRTLSRIFSKILLQHMRHANASIAPNAKPVRAVPPKKLSCETLIEWDLFGVRISVASAKCEWRSVCAMCAATTTTASIALINRLHWITTVAIHLLCDARSNKKRNIAPAEPSFASCAHKSNAKP